MTIIIIVAIIAGVVYYIHYLLHGNHKDAYEVEQNANVKGMVLGGNANEPVEELQYFCIKDKGYSVNVWPKDYKSLDIIWFFIAGIEYRDNMDSYLGEFKGTLEAEPTNQYDKKAIKVLAPDGHHVGYVPRDTTAEVRRESTLPCPCFCYIGKRNGVYFSKCYIPLKK